MNEIPKGFFDIPLPNFKDHKKREQLFNNLKPTFEKIRTHALERVKENTPDVTSENGIKLKDTINVDVEVDNNGNLIFGFNSTFPNVLAIHEAEYQFKPGETSKSTPEGGVGNKFFTRVIDHWASTWTDWFQQGLDEQIRKGSKNEVFEIKS